MYSENQQLLHTRMYIIAGMYVCSVQPPRGESVHTYVALGVCELHLCHCGPLSSSCEDLDAVQSNVVVITPG